MEPVIQPGLCRPLTALLSARIISQADTSSAGGVRCLVHVVFLWGLPAEAERSHTVGFLAVRPLDSSAEGGRDLFSLVLTRSVYCACLCPPAGRANRALVPGALSGVTHLIS